MARLWSLSATKTFFGLILDRPNGWLVDPVALNSDNRAQTSFLFDYFLKLINKKTKTVFAFKVCNFPRLLSPFKKEKTI